MSEYRSELVSQVRGLIREVPDFPKPGILFKDLTPVFADGRAFKALVQGFVERYRSKKVDAFVGIEARGFVVATPVAVALERGIVLVRKQGKLPWKTVSKSYGLEYGSDVIQIHEDAIQPGMRVVVLDDLLATGGTLRAAIDLVKGQGGEVLEAAVVVELAFLRGRERLQDVPVTAMIVDG